MPGVGAVNPSGQLRRARQYRAGLIDVVEVVNALKQRGDAFHAHAGVDVLRGQFAEHREVGLAGACCCSALVLHEDEVPELHVAVLVNLRTTGCSVVGPTVVIQLTARPARSRDAHRPEVVVHAAAHDPFERQADRLVPDVDGLVIVVVDGGPDPVPVEAEAAVVEALRRQVPGQPDSAVLEVVAEAEVAVHLEERAVPSGLAHLLDVRRADALLHAGRTRPRRGLLADEVGHELHHAGDDEEQVRVVEGQRQAGHDGVAARLEVAQEALAHLRGLHLSSLLPCVALVLIAGLIAGPHSLPGALIAWRTHSLALPWLPNDPSNPVSARNCASRSVIVSRTSVMKSRTDRARSANASLRLPAMPPGVSRAVALDSLRTTSTPIVIPMLNQNSRRTSGLRPRVCPSRAFLAAGPVGAPGQAHPPGPPQGTHVMGTRADGAR